MSQPAGLRLYNIMRQSGRASTSTLDSDYSDDASIHQSGSSLDTAPSTAPQSSGSSVKSSSNVPTASSLKRLSLKSSLKTSKSATSLGVRFSLPEPIPKMPGVERDVPLPPRKCPQLAPLKSEQQPGPETLSPTGTQLPLRKKLSKRFSAPAVPVSRKELQRTHTSSIATPTNSRNFSLPRSKPTSRATSFQSTASAPPALQFTPSPSHPPSQYNPLQHYIPCQATNCKKHYTVSLLGPTYHFPQGSYKLTRKSGLCPFHANQNLKAAGERAKTAFESMRQNAGRKTLGLIAAEFEIWLQEFRDERDRQSQELEEQQRRKLLGGPKTKKKDKTQNDEEWDWHYAPRPCTRKGCAKDDYSPFDNRLYLFYNTPRPSGLTPLSTLCPTCARSDVEAVEERIEGRREESGGDEVWKEWFWQIRKDRNMEIEFWEQAQERVVKEKSGNWPAAVTKNTDTNNVAVETKKEKKQGKLKDICVVM